MVQYILVKQKKLHIVEKVGILPYLQNTHFTFSFKAEVKKKHENVDSLVIAKFYFEKAIKYLIQSYIFI